MLEKPDTSKRRQGGRLARRQQRAAGPTPEEAPLWPGLNGGTYQPLTDAEVLKIHQAALDVLSRIGMGNVPQDVEDRALKLGCSLNSAGRLCYPVSLIEDAIAQAARSITLFGRDSAHDLEVSGKKVYFGTGGAAVRTLDINTQKYRPSTLQDLYDFARLADTLEHVSWFSRNIVATEISDPLVHDVNTAYAITAGTRKHIGMSFSTSRSVEPVMALFDTVGGGAGTFKRRPFCKAHIIPVVPPLRYGEDAIRVMHEVMPYNMPITIINAAQAGATGPAPLATMLVQTTAEGLAGLLLTHLYQPGYPVIFSNWPFVSDLRTGAFSGGGGEIALLNAAAAQMTHFYNLPGGVSASMADAKVPDAQAGYEKAITTLTAGLAGANLIYESVGMFASLIGSSFEGFVIDNEMLASVLRAVRGIEVTDETLDTSVIENVVNGAGHYLGHDQTIQSMIRDYCYPELGDRQTPDIWAATGSTTLWTRAREKTKQILTTHYPNYIDRVADETIRGQFDIRLPSQMMSANNSSVL